MFTPTNVTDSINSLTSTEPLTISGGTLSIAAASTIGSTLSISGGTLTGTGDVSVSGLVTLTAGTLSGSSALNANGGMLINPAGGQFNLDGRTVNNAAGQTATWTGSHIDNFIEASDGSVFNNLGTFVANSTALTSESGTGAASSFNNVGSFIATANTANVGFNVPFNVPGGSVDVKDGSQLDLDQGGTSTGAAFNIESNGSSISADLRLRHGHDHQRHRYAARLERWCYRGTTLSRVPLTSTTAPFRSTAR